jgi:hypothetical protein
MGVAVDDAGRARVDRLAGCAEIRADRGNAPAGNSERARAPRCARPVDDDGVLDEESVSASCFRAKG